MPDHVREEVMIKIFGIRMMVSEIGYTKVD